MPVHLTWEQHGLYRRFTDPVTSALLVRIKEENIGDERFDTLHYTICDFSGVSDFSSRSEDLAYLCALDKATALYRPGICIASVAPDERIASVMRSLRDSGVSPYPRGVFRSVEQARAWISSRLREQGFHDQSWIP